MKSNNHTDTAERTAIEGLTESDSFTESDSRIGGAAETMQELVTKRVLLLSRRRIAWLRKVWAEIAERQTESFNAHTEVDGYLENLDLPTAEIAWMEEDVQMQSLSYELAEAEDRLLNEQDSRLTRLTGIFGLSQAEADVLQACLSIAIDPNLGRVFAYLQDNAGRGYVTDALVGRLFGHGHCLLLSADCPLKIWGLVRETIFSSGEPARLECDPYIKNWLLGKDGTDEVLYPFVTIQPVQQPLQDWPVSRGVDFINRMVKGDPQCRMRIFVSGPEGSGRRSYSAIVARQFGLTLLSVDADRVPENRWQQIYMHVQRQARLSNTVPAWHGTVMLERYWPLRAQSYPIQFVIGEVDSFILPESGWMDLRIELPELSVEERRRLWKQFVAAVAGWKKADMEEMILRYQVTIGQIVSIGKKMTATLPEAYSALRSDSARRLGTLAQLMNSEFTWSDLVLPEYIRKTLEDFSFEATERTRFWEEAGAKRLFPQGKSLIALFTGDPGTGKTMAAQVIASSLKLDLFRIDLSTVVSKYIGESSKNIERILARAKTMNVVLFFDEADSLFGKRTEIKDAHDRYANTDTNYLLQAIEQYPGIVILASNKKSNIDTGFMRRLRYMLEFPKPDAPHRLRLWTTILSELAGEDTVQRLEKDLEKLAQLIEITGAQIKQAILSALFMARREKSEIGLGHLLSGLERELMKEGKGLGRQIQQILR
ncbi:MAG TPA: ATP-binding protein [Puia sp.]|nr:ATP-binding protein [Puia sp.]